MLGLIVNKLFNMERINKFILKITSKHKINNKTAEAEKY